MSKYKIIYHYNDGTSDEDTNLGNYFPTRDEADSAGMMAISHKENNLRDFEIVELDTEGNTSNIINRTDNDVRYCYKCGSSISAGIAFCPYCGTPLNEQQYGLPSNYNEHGWDDNDKETSYHFTKTLFMVLCLLSSIACLAGLFMPYVSAYIISVSLQDLTKGEGDFPLFIAVAVIGMVFAAFKLFLGCALDGILFFVIHSIDTNVYWSEISSVGAYVNKGIGFYAITGGAICLTVFGITGFVEKIRYKKYKKTT